ncbi:MAG TPA: NAD-dependent epimerase/dehydratase family protein [Acidimicrobiia bacterium]|nr:NAD-dependent epimerase/dehydratase family protein [Acidimicrobiia bacterium]
MTPAAADGPGPGSSAVLVTGGAGFIGTAVLRALSAGEHTVRVVDRSRPRDASVTSIVGDLRDPEVRCAAVTEATGTIVHLAAATSVVGSISDPARVFDDNVAVTAALLELARVRGVRRFVLASTNAVVGSAADGVITERSPLGPLTPYGGTKAACEMLLSSYGGSYDLAPCALRFTNVYGVGMRNKDSLVARLMRAALSGATLQVYGDGGQRRDFIHVTDVAAAVRLAVERAWTGTVVVGSGTSSSVLELVDAVRRVSGTELPVEHVPARDGEMRAVDVDITRARGLGFEPRMPLDDGLASLWAEARETWGEAS